MICTWSQVYRINQESSQSAHSDFLQYKAVLSDDSVLGWKGERFSQTAGVQTGSPTFSVGILGKLLNIYEPQFLHWRKCKVNDNYLVG